MTDTSKEAVEAHIATLGFTHKDEDAAMIRALAAENERLKAQAVKVRELVWDAHPDGEGFYAFPNDAGSALYVVDRLESGQWRLFIGGDVVLDDNFEGRTWPTPDGAKAYAQDDVSGRVRRILSAIETTSADEVCHSEREAIIREIATFPINEHGNLPADSRKAVQEVLAEIVGGLARALKKGGE